MLLTALEIIAFMVAAAIIGVLLGWVLRGTLGNEQMEIVDLRAQLRQLKKANRESKSAMVPASDIAVGDAAKANAKANVKAADGAETKPSSTKKASTQKTAKARSAKTSSARKTQAERQADRDAGAKSFAEVVDRVGNSDADDKLTKIHGVGKKYASMLNDLGISSYAQITKLKKADVRTLAVALGVLDDRLETEDWVGSAKILMKEAK